MDYQRSRTVQLLDSYRHAGLSAERMVYEGGRPVSRHGSAIRPERSDFPYPLGHACTDATKSNYNRTEKRDVDLMVIRRSPGVVEVWLHAGLTLSKDAAVTVSVDSSTELDFSPNGDAALAFDVNATVVAFKDGSSAVGHSPTQGGETVTDEFSLMAFTAA